MPMTLEEFREAIKALPNAVDVEEFVSTAIETEKQTGIASRRKANNEAQQLRRWKLAIEQAGYEGEDAEGILEWLQSKASAPADDKGGQSNPEIEKLRREFTKAQKELEEARTSAQKIKAQADKRTIKAKLVDALREKVYGHDLLAENLINEGRVKLAEDEEVIFVNGDDEIDFQTGVKKLLESRPDLLRNTQAPGARSGTRPQAGAPRYSLDQLKNMSAQDIAADMENVLASVASSKK